MTVNFKPLRAPGDQRRSESVMVRLTDQEKEALSQLATDRDMTMSDMIRVALSAWLEREV